MMEKFTFGKVGSVKAMSTTPTHRFEERGSVLAERIFLATVLACSRRSHVDILRGDAAVLTTFKVAEVAVDLG